MTLTSSDRTTQKNKILLVDDDKIALEELSDIVDLEGWDAVTANSVESALDLLEVDQTIRVVLTDVHFVAPSGEPANGIQFISRAQARFPERKLSYLVLSGDPDAQMSAAQVGAFNFLNKPLAPETLIDALAAALASDGEEPDVSCSIDGPLDEAVTSTEPLHPAGTTVQEPKSGVA